jgi:hypothetical protein
MLFMYAKADWPGSIGVGAAGACGIDILEPIVLVSVSRDAVALGVSFSVERHMYYAA